MTLYKSRYRVESTRLQNWNYGWNALYFVTICTQNKKCHFGEITVDTPNLGVSTIGISLSIIGEIAKKYWYKIPQHFPFIKLHEFIVMPNHIHGIIEIAKSDDENETPMFGVETPKLGVSTGNTGKKNVKWESGTLGVIINQYKRIITINVRKTDNDFAWQPRFYDHIIRNEKSYIKISDYIINNPEKWNKDKFYTHN
jgi:putative transposase